MYSGGPSQSEAKKKTQVIWFVKECIFKRFSMLSVYLVLLICFRFVCILKKTENTVSNFLCHSPTISTGIMNIVL